MGYDTWILVKSQIILIWLDTAVWRFPGIFRHRIGLLSSKLVFLLSRNYILYTHYVRKSSSCLNICDSLPRNSCFVLAFTCTREHLIIKCTHTSLTSLENKKQFANEPRHLRRTWDLSTRVFDEAGSILLGMFLFGHYIFGKNVLCKQIWILLADSFSYMVLNLS